MEDLEDRAGLNCIALYKIAKIKGVPIPDEGVHVYLSKLISLFESPLNSLSKLVVWSVEELEKTANAYKNDPQPNAIPYLVSKYSGDYSTNYNAHINNTSNLFFPSVCYSFAQYYSAKMGKREDSRIFGLLALNPEKYISLLASYYSLSEEDNFEITDDDFLEFKKHVEKSSLKNKLLKIPKKNKEKIEKNILI